MNLRQLLKRDFGIEVLVQGGTGLADDPFVIEPCSAMDARRTQLNLLRGLERGRGELWRLLQAEPVAPAVQRLRIKTVLFTRDEIISETRRYYFDVSQVDGVPDAAAPFIEWEDPRTTFSATYQIGWLNFDRATLNNQSKDVLDTSLHYSSVGATATIYIYESADPFTWERSPVECRAKELESVCDEIRAIQPNLEAPWPVQIAEPFAFQAFLSGEDMTIAGIALLGRLFLKLRLTFFDDPKMRELMQETIQDVVRLAQMAGAGRARASHARH
jgi:hypothetical protein